MSKKKKKPVPLDDAARARIAERHARKAVRKEDREAHKAAKALRRAEEARRWDPEVVAQRAASNQVLLASEAWIVVTVDEQVIAGLLPPAADGTTQLVLSSGNREPEPPFDQPEHALLWLYAEAYGPSHPELDPMGALARARGETPANSSQAIPNVRITARFEAAEQWLESARQVLIAQYRDGTLEEEDEDLFYEFVADDEMRCELDARAKREHDAWMTGRRGR